MRRPHLPPELVLTARPLQPAGPLLAALVLACGGGDGAGPDALPDLTGRYRAVRALAAVTCTPQRPPVGGGTVVLDAFADTVQVRIQQAGSRLTLTYPDFPGSPADTGSVTQDGTVTIAFRETFQEAPRAGNRTFFVDLTVAETLRRADGGARLIGSGTYVNVFREGAATSPVFATCSRPSTIEYTRTGS
jgi:hypothetical protein